MKRGIYVWMIFMGIAIVTSCNNQSLSDETSNNVAENRIFQKTDGTISLKINKADCYQDAVNPSSNTAEWNIVVSKSGRYDVWLSSATTDTTNLRFDNSVLLSIRDSRLETMPAVNRIVHNSTEVSKPYYQADSFMGSLYIQDTGVYSVQVISDKVLPDDFRSPGSPSNDPTKIVSVSLTPVRH